jgi:hypothetical protein
LFYKIEEKTNTFQNTHKLKQSMTIKPALQKSFNGNLNTEEEDKHNHENKGNNKSHYSSG